MTHRQPEVLYSKYGKDRRQIENLMADVIESMERLMKKRGEHESISKFLVSNLIELREEFTAFEEGMRSKKISAEREVVREKVQSVLQRLSDVTTAIREERIILDAVEKEVNALRERYRELFRELVKLEREEEGLDKMLASLPEVGPKT